MPKPVPVVQMFKGQSGVVPIRINTRYFDDGYKPKSKPKELLKPTVEASSEACDDKGLAVPINMPADTGIEI